MVGRVWVLPKNVAQLTGVVVTSIVVFGTDLDVFYAVPFGVFAGALAVFFVALFDARERIVLRSGRFRRN